jgi:hypothetical protein
LVVGVRMRRKQLHTLDHLLLLVIEEPVLTRLEAGNDRMPRCCRMPGSMLAGRTVAAANVAALRAPAEMKPPPFRRSQAFDTAIAARPRSAVDSSPVSFHFRFSFRVSCSQMNLTAPAGSSRYHPFLLPPGLRPLHSAAFSCQSGLPVSHLAPLRP